MGPEEIHIFFWEGVPRPPKRKCDQPKNLEVFLVNFKFANYLLLLVLLFFKCNEEGWLKSKLTQPKLSLSWFGHWIYPLLYRYLSSNTVAKIWKIKLSDAR